LVYKFLVYYGLPIYYIDNTFPNLIALLGNDDLHPTVFWHEQMAQRAYDFLQRGA
jgi:hypothetical protein